MPAAPEIGSDIDSVYRAPSHSWAAGTGPGLASTAADNDPGGIATYSLAGAQGALYPLAGRFAPAVLGVLLIGTGLLALPPLAGSAANAAVSAFGLQHGALRDRRIAHVVLGLMIVGLVVALSLFAFHFEPIHILYSILVLGAWLACEALSYI
ncbi:hypothetical protein AB1286_21545 [Trinickia sp. NRRL B-1857]|uniref:hypothetical protein n=1 Tax=Trinickia sp. NRRL B-1857 TaxID=3162879 RepID=UPI003D2982A0